MAQAETPGARRARFGGFELDLRSAELSRGGDREQLQEKPFLFLVTLLERPGEVVLRQELADRLWGDDVHVDFDTNLNAAVRKLRAALGDSATEPRFIETVPRRGYRFIAAVERVAGEGAAPAMALARPGPVDAPEPPSPASGPAPPSTAPSPFPSRSRPWLLAAALGALVLLGGLALWQTRPIAATAAGGEASLLVLPFENLSGDPAEEYVSDGLTEEIITHLGRLDPPRLKVLGRLTAMSLKGQELEAQELRRRLEVDYVLRGSARRSGDKLRVTARLMEGESGDHLWAETFDFPRQNLLRAQSAVAVRVARSLTRELLPEEQQLLVRAATTSAEAYDAYLQGRHAWKTFQASGYRRSIVHFERALEADPGYGPAAAGIADAYNLLAFTGELPPAEAFRQAEEAARGALALDPDLAEAHNSLAFARLYGRWDVAGSLTGFARAVELAPSYAMAYHWQAGALSAAGRYEEAIAAMERSLELEPVALSVISDLGWYYLFADRYQEGEALCKEALAEHPGYGWMKSCLLQAYVSQGRWQEWLALAVPDSGVSREDRTPAGASREVIEQWAEANAPEDPSQADPVNLTQLYAVAGRTEEAFTWLQRALDERHPWLVFLAADPRFDPLHGDPRFDRALLAVGLRPDGGLRSRPS